MPAQVRQPPDHAGQEQQREQRDDGPQHRPAADLVLDPEEQHDADRADEQQPPPPDPASPASGGRNRGALVLVGIRTRWHAH
jgi:hypothetical protein